MPYVAKKVPESVLLRRLRPLHGLALVAMGIAFESIQSTSTKLRAVVRAARLLGTPQHQTTKEQLPPPPPPALPSPIPTFVPVASKTPIVAVAQTASIASFQNESSGAQALFRYDVVTTGGGANVRVAVSDDAAALAAWDGRTDGGPGLTIKTLSDCGIEGTSAWPASASCSWSLASEPTWKKFRVRFSVSVEGAPDGPIALSPVSTIARVPTGMVFLAKEIWPSELSALAYDFAIDKYEGSLKDSIPFGQAGATLVSLQGVQPAAAGTFNDFATACGARNADASAAGFVETYTNAPPRRRFKLSSDVEWRVAAARTRERSGCRVSEGTPRVTGASMACQTLDGVHDLVGNVSEWIDLSVDLDAGLAFHGPNTDAPSRVSGRGIVVPYAPLPANGQTSAAHPVSGQPTQTIPLLPIAEATSAGDFFKATSGLVFAARGGDAGSQGHAGPGSLRLADSVTYFDALRGARCALSAPTSIGSVADKVTILGRALSDGVWRRGGLAIDGDTVFVARNGGGIDVLQRQSQVASARDTVLPLTLYSGLPAATATDIATSPGLLFVLSSSLLDVRDVTVPLTPTVRATLSLPGCTSPRSLSVAGDRGAVACQDGVRLLDLRNSAAPVVSANISSYPNGRRVLMDGSKLFVRSVAAGVSSFAVFDVSDVAIPVLLGGLASTSFGDASVPTFLKDDNGSNGMMVKVRDGIIAVGNSGGAGGWTYTDTGVALIDVSDPSAPRVTANLTSTNASVVAAVGNRLYAQSHYTAGDDNFAQGNIWDVSDARLPQLLARRIEWNSPALSAKQGPTSVVAFPDGLLVVSLEELTVGVATLRVNP
jgi:hypothetical protein